MARLNTRSYLVATAGRPALSPAGDRANTPPLLASASNPPFSPVSGSEKENARTGMDKGKGRAQDARRGTQPSARQQLTVRGAKRRRISHTESTPISSEEDVESESEEPPTPSVDGDDVEDVAESHATNLTTPEGEPINNKQKGVRFYDQAQDEEERRELKRETRRLERKLLDNRDEYLKPENTDLTPFIDDVNKAFDGVKQTADATTDSRLMVNVSDIAYRKSSQLVLGDSAVGVDVDEFVSKCISFMRRSDTQIRRRHSNDEDDDDEAEVLDWAYLGTHACFPHNSRPSVPQFLLGPLSVQKRIRTVQRRARQRADDRPMVAPEQLHREDLEANEPNTVRHACASIKAELIAHCKRAEDSLQEAIPDSEDISPQDFQELLRKHRLTDSGGPNLFDFVINPHSFGQTVENFFYISFLIKEGEVGLTFDDNGMPCLNHITETVEHARARKSTRHQTVFGLDEQIWKDLILALDIKEPLIPHRSYGEASVGAKGWYS